jgi:hypothetical protein
MQGLRKIFRAIAIVLCSIFGSCLLVDAALHGAADYQLLVSAGLLLFAGGMVLTWFWSPFA